MRVLVSLPSEDHISWDVVQSETADWTIQTDLETIHVLGGDLPTAAYLVQVATCCGVIKAERFMR